MATKVLDDLESRFRQLVQFPHSGAPRPHLARGLRVVFCDSYAIYYLSQAGEIVIVRVLHGSRDVEAVSDDGGFGV